MMRTRKFFRPSRPDARGAFTILELLIVVAVIGVLITVVAVACNSAIGNAKQIREIAAARTLIAAYRASEADHDGRFLRGYDRTINQLPLPDGTVLSGPPAQRYPFRLAPYFDSQYDGTLLVNDSAKEFDTTNTYLVSVFPALGINYIFVGGDFSSSGAQTYPAECVCSVANAAVSPLVFASAGTGDGAQRVDGYCILTPPRLIEPMWKAAPWISGASAGDYGNVDSRFDGKAVCAFLDGGIRLLTIEDLRDMRLWSVKAALLNDPNYSIPGG